MEGTMSDEENRSKPTETLSTSPTTFLDYTDNGDDDDDDDDDDLLQTAAFLKSIQEITNRPSPEPKLGHFQNLNSSVDISDFVWVKVQGMDILCPAQVLQILASTFIVYISSDNDRFSVKKSDTSIMPFKEHVSVLKAEGIEYFKRHKMKRYLKYFLADVHWALNGVRNDVSDDGTKDTRSITKHSGTRNVISGPTVSLSSESVSSESEEIEKDDSLDVRNDVSDDGTKDTITTHSGARNVISGPTLSLSNKSVSEESEEIEKDDSLDVRNDVSDDGTKDTITTHSGARNVISGPTVSLSNKSVSEESEEIEKDDSLDVTYQPERNDYQPKKIANRSSTSVKNKEGKIVEENSSDAEISYASDSSASDDKMSDIFPALTQTQENVHTVSESSEEDEDEESILGDIDNPNIYISKILESSTTKTGKAKKHNQVFNSYQYCGACHKKVSNLSQHLERNSTIHDGNPDIKEFKQETDKKKKKILQTLLRGKFNHAHNMTIIKKGKGEILLERRPREFRLKEYGPCPKCFLWFAKKLLKKHSKKCVNKNLENLSSGDLTTQSDCLTRKIETVASTRLITEVFSKMQQDLVTDVVKGDLLITQLGNQWLEKNVGNQLKRGVYTSQIIRLMGRFLMILRNIKPIDKDENGSLWDYLKPCHFDALVEACIMTASPLEIDDTMKAPSNAIKIGYDLKHILNGKIGLSIIRKDEVSQEDAEKTLKLMNIYWGSKVTKAARVILLERSYYAKKNLPSPEDIQCLSIYLKKLLEKFDYSRQDITNYRRIGEAVQAKLVIYNRRRTGEVQAARLRDYNRRSYGTEGEHLLGKCSELEQKLLESQEVMTIRGKVGRAVPVILPEDVQKGLKYISDLNIRSTVGVSEANEYLFASEGESIIWAYDSVRKAAEAARLENPKAVTSTNLRKYMATVTQVLDLKESQMQWVLNHLGHTMDVHKLHYRATSDILERTQIAKILLLQDQGRIGAFKNKQLDDIDMADVVFQDQETEIRSDRTERVSEYKDETISGLVSPGIVNETLQEAESFFGEGIDNIRKCRKRPISTIKTHWTKEEEDEIRC